ncbi:hypothetical protein D3C85_1640400 [compost metagenome]
MKNADGKARRLAVPIAILAFGTLKCAKMRKSAVSVAQSAAVFTVSASSSGEASPRVTV